MATTVLEHCVVLPSSDAPAEHSLSLIHFDLVLLDSPPIQNQNLIFYDIPRSKSHFLESIVPKLKTSLSLTLNNFLPFAGKIRAPLSPSGWPVCHYNTGDSLSLTISESSADFIKLTGNHPRDADEFKHFVQELPPANYSSDIVEIPVCAVQLTLFPNQGLCIGLTYNHAIADGTTILAFFQAWASATKFMTTGPSGKNVLEKEFNLPLYERSGVENPSELSSSCWKQVHMRGKLDKLPPSIVLPADTVQATFVFSEDEIKKLKSSASVSSFVAVSAHIWTCLAKSAALAGEEVSGDDAPEYFACPVDCRKRLNPPLPQNYFGNCLTFVTAESTHGKLKGTDGFPEALRLIDEAIHKILHSENGILDNFLERYVGLGELYGKRVMFVNESPRFDYYSSDFGWGEARKFEPLRNGMVSFHKSREFERGMEVTLSLPSKLKMDYLAAMLFHDERDCQSRTTNEFT